MEEDYLPDSLDWKNHIRGWPYSSDAPQNKKWKKDRAKLFNKSGNGWWYYHGYIIRHSTLSEYDKINIRRINKL